MGGSPRGGPKKGSPGANSPKKIKPADAWSNKAPCYIIDPRTSTWIGKWDIFTSIALVFVAFVTPYEVALLEVSLDLLFFINRLVDVIFIIDLCFSFVTVYAVKEVYVTDPRRIAKHYFTSWFPLDVVSVSISAIDIYVVAASGSNSGGGGDDALDNLRMLRVVRVLRFFRVLKLLRVMRAAKVFATWESKVAIDYNTLQLVKSITAAFVVSHWIACIWIMQAFIFQIDAPLRSWLTDSYPYCWPAAADQMYDCRGAELLYSASLYHTMLCMFGGLEATPGNGVEMVFATFLMLISGLVWSHVMATVVGIVSMSDPDEAAFRATMDSLNQYMSRECMPDELRQRAREFFQKSKHVQRSDRRGELLEHMPYSLQSEFVLFSSRIWIDRVWFLKSLTEVEDHPFLVDFAKQVSAKVFCPGDWTPSGFLYIIHRGIALYKAGVLTRGKVFGEDFMLASEAIRDASSARAMNYLEVYVCSREDVLVLADRYPETWRKVRKLVLFRTMRKAIINKRTELLGILEQFRDLCKRGILSEDGPNDATAAHQPLQEPAGGLAGMGLSPKGLSPIPRPVALVPGPFEERGALARARARKNRQERRAGSLLSSIGSSISDKLSPTNKALSNSPSRAQIGDFRGGVPATPQVEVGHDSQRMRHANGGGSSRSPPYRTGQGYEDDDPDDRNRRV